MFHEIIIVVLFGIGSTSKSKNACLTLHHLGSNFSMVVIGLNRGVSSKFLTIIELGVLPDVNNSFSTLVTIAVSPFQIRVKHSNLILSEVSRF